MSNSTDASSHHSGWRPRASKTAIVVTIGLGVATVCCAGLLPCIQQTRDTSTQGATLNNLKQIALALQDYHDTFGHLPPPVVTDKSGHQLYSWRVALLPFLEQDSLYKQFHADEPWDSPQNYQLLAQMPRIYWSPWGDNDPINTTRFQVLVGPGTAFEREGLTWNDFPDGRENTITVVEAADPVLWTKPVGLPYDPKVPLPKFREHRMPVEFICYTVGHRQRFVAAFGDGRVHFIRADTTETMIRALITRNGGEKVDVASLD